MFAHINSQQLRPHASDLYKLKTTEIPPWMEMGHEVPPVTEELLAIDIFCERKSAFFWDVNPERLSMLQAMISHTCTYK